MRTILLFICICQVVTAAPYPMTGSSLYLDNKKNLFLWPFKIELNLQQSPYEIDLSQNDADKWSIKTGNHDIQVFARIRRLGLKDDYDKTLKSWIREYQKSGFQIIGQQIPRKNAERGWIHLQDAQSDKQLVQYFRFHDRTWVYFNCVGKKEELSLLKQTCNFLSSTLQFR